MGALRAAVHAAGAAFVDVAVLVHERVVADVAPTQVVGVVVPDAAHDSRCLGFGVVVGAGSVVHGGGGGGLAVVGGAAAAGAPLRAGDNLGHALGVGVGHGLDATFGGAGAAVQEHGLDVLGGGGCVGDGAAALEQVHVAGGDLDACGAADVDRLGAELVGARLRVYRVHLEPLGPGAVGLLGAHVRGDVALAGPGQAHDGELAVVGKLLDHAAHLLFFAALGADGGVVDGDVVAGRERRGGGVDLRGTCAEGLHLQDAVAAECVGGNECCDEEDGHDHGHDRGPGGVGRAALNAATLLHSNTPEVLCVHCESSGKCDRNEV